MTGIGVWSGRTAQARRAGVDAITCVVDRAVIARQGDVCRSGGVKRSRRERSLGELNISICTCE